MDEIFQRFSPNTLDIPYVLFVPKRPSKIPFCMKKGSLLTGDLGRRTKSHHPFLCIEDQDSRSFVSQKFLEGYFTHRRTTRYIFLIEYLKYRPCKDVRCKKSLPLQRSFDILKP